MKKLLGILMSVLFLASLVGCSAGSKSENVNVNELKKNTGDMFVATYAFGDFTSEEKYVNNATFIFHYDGTFDIQKDYNDNQGTYFATGTLSDEDYVTLYVLSRDALKKNDFGNYQIDGFEGGLWRFTFYEQGSSSPQELFYGGFGSGNVTLDFYRNLMNSYLDTLEYVDANGEAEVK